MDWVLSCAAIVKTERLFVNVPDQMERFQAHVSAMQTALQEGPEVFHALGVNQTAQIFARMINNVVIVLPLKASIGGKLVRVELSSILSPYQITQLPNYSIR